MCGLDFRLAVPVTDRHGFTHQTVATAAIAPFERAVFELAAHRPGTAPELAKALAADPDLLAAHCLRGFAGVIAGRPGAVAAAKAAEADAQAALLRRGGATPDELVHLSALALAVTGHLIAAADRLDMLLARRTDLLTLKLAVALRFMSGQPAEMRRTTETGLARWQHGAEGRGFALGCHAFSLGETGDQRNAELEGRAALLLEPHDAWGLHAVAHACEMQGKPEQGIVWVEATRPIWRQCNNFGQHVAWHLALFHVEHRRFDTALAIYDEEVRPLPSDEMRDVANAASLLWRLRQDGVDVGPRWDALAASARSCRTETTLLFGSLHNLLTLIAVGDTEAARQTMMAIELKAIESDDQARVAAQVAVPLGHALLGLGPASAGLSRRLVKLGGSHAQRDVFVRSLAELAANAGDLQSLAAILDARHRIRRLDRFAARFAPDAARNVA